MLRFKDTEIIPSQRRSGGEERLYGKCGLNFTETGAITTPLARRRLPVSTAVSIVPCNFTHIGANCRMMDWCLTRRSGDSCDAAPLRQDALGGFGEIAASHGHRDSCFSFWRPKTTLSSSRDGLLTFCYFPLLIFLSLLPLPRSHLGLL